MMKLCGAITGALAAAVLLGAAAQAATSVQSPPVVYVHAVCSTLATYEQRIVKRGNQLELKHIVTPVQGKRALQAYMLDVLRYTASVLKGLKAAGVPAVANGVQVASGILRSFTQLQRVLRRAKSAADRLPTDSVSKFNSAGAKLARMIKADVATIRAPLARLRSTALRAAAVKDPVCQSL